MRGQHRINIRLSSRWENVQHKLLLWIYCNTIHKHHRIHCPSSGRESWKKPLQTQSWKYCNLKPESSYSSQTLKRDRRSYKSVQTIELHTFCHQWGKGINICWYLSRGPLNILFNWLFIKWIIFLSIQTILSGLNFYKCFDIPRYSWLYG